MDLCWQSNVSAFNTLSRGLVFPSDSDSKESACNAGGLGSIPKLGRSPREGMATNSSIVAWKIPWWEEHGGPQSMGSQRVGHDWATNTLTLTLTRFVIAFLPRSKRLLISWLQSPSAVILEPENEVCHCFLCFPIYLPWSDGTRCHDLSFLNVEF